MSEYTEVQVADLHRFATEAFMAAGARADEAATVAEELVVADRSGVSSHGVIRVSSYLEAIAAGSINLTADVRVLAETGAMASVDGDRGFGQVVGRYALDTASAKARENGIGLVVVRNSYHIGRIGSLCETGAAQGLLVLAFVAVGIPGPVAPFGGREGRLGTNPIAFGVPHGDSPIVADFATAAMPEGVIVLNREMGRNLPAGVLVDSDGMPSTDPNALYTSPPGAILPFGGTWGHRGYALNLMVELFAGTLAGYGPHAADRTSNCMFLIVVDPAHSAAGGSYERLVTETAEFVTSAAPAAGATVMLPGHLEAEARRRSAQVVSVASTTLDSLEAIASRFSLRSPARSAL